MLMILPSAPQAASDFDPNSPRSQLERNEAAAGGGGGNGLQSTIANFLVIGGFAAFAFVVQQVLQTIAASND